MLFDIENVSFTYPSLKRKVLDSVNFKISEGDVLSVLGRNGSGKSTLLNCMLGILKTQGGAISLSGKFLHDMSEREIASVVGYVPQSHVPAFGYTVFDFVQMGCASRIGLFSHPGRKERDDTAAVLSEMKIEQLADRPYTELSGGEQQQAIIARAIVSRPRIILFDEPTAHLDFGNQLRVLRLIKDLSEKGFAVVITTHNPDHAMLLGGRAAILDRQGHLISGKVDDIVTEASLKDVYSSDLKLKYIEEFGRRVCVYPNL
ncbi:MAG: iron ABC transporter ATP-binding protein [Firmicutes bacterium HGW-Firmicutes-16]|nr:MAG: iron ABC transporter ATP-binding protein [Firmicutes bacterium HGW-Firmicutes-16]